MKKSLLALAVLGAFAGVASAQSSVTLFGIVDLNAQYVKNDGAARRVSLSQDGLNSSRFGVRGTEDLGGGLKAGFWLEGALSADTGTADATKFWGRRSVVQLIGGFGEVRLGRDYTPTFWNQTNYDAFGTVGLGNSLNVAQLTSNTFVRADNSISYFLPAGIGGLFGQVMVAAGEGVPEGKYVGGRVGFGAGPFEVAAAYGQQNTSSGDKHKTANVGGSYDFGVAKLMGYYNRDTLADLKENRYSISGVVPIGQGEIHAGYDRSKGQDNTTGTSNTISKFAVGYVYNLSKRTALYSNVARLSNGSLSAVSVGNGPAPTAGGKSTGAEFGVRHIF